MATFYPQVLSNESLLQQWQRYLKNKPIINNIEDIIQNQTKDYKEMFEHTSQQQINAIQQSTFDMCESLESGFDLLSEHLQEISYGIGELRSEVNAMASMLDWKLSLFIEQQKITNLLLGNIAVLLRIPDIQKERQYHIEQGIKFLKNAFFDVDFFEDALKNLLKAEIIESSDFFALHRIGLIYMYSPKHLDLSKAEEYFKKAAKYAVAETNIGASFTTNYLTGDTNKDLLTQAPTIDSIKLQAAESYMFAGRSCYIQGKFGEASELAEKSFSIVPNLVEAGFTQVKALSANNNISEAVTVLETVIKKDRFFIIKTVSDLDLIIKPEIKNVLEKLRQEAFDEASNLLNDCKENMIDESMAKDEINKIEKLINKKSFLHCKKAIDIMNKNKIRVFSQVFLSNNNENNKENRHLNELPDLITSFCDKVKYPESYVSKINKFLSFLSENTQWVFPEINALSAGYNFNIEIKAKELNSCILSFIQKEKEYYEKLPSVKKELQNVIEEIYKDDSNRRLADKIACDNRLIQEQKSRNKASLNYAFGYLLSFGSYGAVTGAIILGLGGCASCLGNYTYDNMLTDFNLFNGLLYGAIGGAILGAFIGFVYGWLKGQE